MTGRIRALDRHAARSADVVRVASDRRSAHSAARGTGDQPSVSAVSNALRSRLCRDGEGRARGWLAALLATGVAVAGCGAGNPFSGDEPLDRSVRPAPGDTPEYDVPAVRRETLANGLQVWLVPRPGIPMVTARLLLDAGSTAEPSAQSGLASLTASMLEEGTSSRTAAEIADELAYLAASLDTGTGRDSTVVSLTTLSRNLEPSLAIMADVVIDPAFPANEWTRVRDQRLVALAQALDQPATLATRQFNRQVFGAAHPLAWPVEGTPATVAALTPAALRQFHAARYRPGPAHLVVAGDFAPDAMMGAVTRAFGGWKDGRAEAPPGPAPPPDPAATRLYLVDKPGAAQSEVRIGHVGVPRNHPDYFPLLVMNTILGGQFSSRINLNLREDKGYTYGARSAFEMGRLAGPFAASGGVQTAATRESIEEFLKELVEIRDARPVTDAEVEFAKASIVRLEPLTLETNAQIAGRLEEVILYDLGTDYLDTYTDRVESVTTADVNRVAREHLRTDSLIVLVVGDRQVIETGLRGLPYPLELLTADALDAAAP